MNNIAIRKLTDVVALEMMQEVERRVWQTNNPIPLHHTVTAVRNGGVALGAFANDLMVGFVYSFPGFVARQHYLCLHSLAVQSDWRSKGVGVLLCRSLAEVAGKCGYSLITWTYDPLETANANLYIAKLGAVCTTYLVNCYGEMRDGLNQGLPTDRLKLAWWLEEPKLALPDDGAAEIVNPYAQGRPGSINKEVFGNKRATLAIVVPRNFQNLKQENTSLAREWRMVTREAFTECFTAGWSVTGFRCRTGFWGEYLLTHRSALTLPREPWHKGS